MKNILSKIVITTFIIAIISCNNKTPVAIDNNPVSDSSKFKIVYDYDVRGDFVSYGEAGYLILVDFSGNIFYYSKSNGKTLNSETQFQLKEFYIKNKLNLDSLNSMFDEYKVSSYPINIPNDIDPNSTFKIPFVIQSLTWRKTKIDNFTFIIIYPKPSTGTFTYPVKFEEFFSNFKTILGFL